jgi:1-acyl-sn-glycerol-3-phosphate acyltransferase
LLLQSVEGGSFLALEDRVDRLSVKALTKYEKPKLVPHCPDGSEESFKSFKRFPNRVRDAVGMIVDPKENSREECVQVKLGVVQHPLGFGIRSLQDLEAAVQKKS